MKQVGSIQTTPLMEEGASCSIFHFQNKLPHLYRTVLQALKKTIRSSTKIHLLFFAFLLIQALTFAFFQYDAILAISSFASLFTTLFSYAITHLYYQAKKPEHLLQIQSQFLQSCKEHIQVPPGDLQHHLCIAHALTNLASYLQNFEASCFRLPLLFKPILPLWRKIALHCYGEDVFKMKKLLLEAALEEHFSQIEITPTNLEVHASLAETYTHLAKLYRQFGLIRKRKKEALLESCRKMEKLAVEELHILNYYAPNDPWVHEQLAKRFSQLEMQEEEMEELETLSTLRPQDIEILSRLGTLYFQRGMHAKGLKIYQSLLLLHPIKAKHLIALYGNQILP